MMNEYKVYDNVWIMHKNRATKLIVYAVIEEMNHSKQGTEKSYLLVHDICGASETSAIRFSCRDEIFKTKEELIASI